MSDDWSPRKVLAVSVPPILALVAAIGIGGHYTSVGHEMAMKEYIACVQQPHSLNREIAEDCGGRP